MFFYSLLKKTIISLKDPIYLSIVSFLLNDPFSWNISFVVLKILKKKDAHLYMKHVRERYQKTSLSILFYTYFVVTLHFSQDIRHSIVSFTWLMCAKNYEKLKFLRTSVCNLFINSPKLNSQLNLKIFSFKTQTLLFVKLLVHLYCK